MKKLPTSAKSKGGKVTKDRTLQRQTKIEKLMTAGYSTTQILAGKSDGKSLGSERTIRKDIAIIRSRWLDQDPEWFHRARLARIEAVERLKAQLIRLNNLLLEIINGNYDRDITIYQTSKTTKPDKTIIETSVPTTFKSKAERAKTLTYAESQLTTVITKMYEIDADFDPEQYLDRKIKEAVNYKIKKRETEFS